MVWPPHHDWLFFQKGKYLVTHRLRFHAKTFVGCLPRGPRAAPQPIGASVLASTNPAALGLIPLRRATPHLHTVHETIVEIVMRPSSLPNCRQCSGLSAQRKGGGEGGLREARNRVCVRVTR